MGSESEANESDSEVEPEEEAQATDLEGVDVGEGHFWTMDE